jgi:hypothetical protein
LGANPQFGQDPDDYRAHWPVDLIVNPIFDTSFPGIGSLDFAPASRVAYNFSETWAAALEHYPIMAG